MNMEFVQYRRMRLGDVEAVIPLRIAQLREEGAKGAMDLAPPLRAYYEARLPDGAFLSFLAVDAGAVVATGGLSFVEKPPYYGNPSGKIALLSSMYTLPAYRRRGVARTLLTLLEEEAKRRGCGLIQTSSSSMGAALYLDFGFQKSERAYERLL